MNADGFHGGTFWTDKREARVMYLWRAGHTEAEIAKAMSTADYAVTVGAVEKRIQILRALQREQDAWWTAERLATLRKLWADSATLSEIRLALGNSRTNSCISQKAHRIGLPPRKIHAPKPPRIPAPRPVVDGRARTRTYAGLSPSEAERPAPRKTAKSAVMSPCPYYDPREKEGRCNEPVDRTPDAAGNVPPPYCKRHLPRVIPQGASFLGLGTPASYARGHRFA